MKNFTQKLRSFTLAAVLMSMSAGVTGQEVVFSENFDKFSEGKANNTADGLDISLKLNEYTQVPGWTGDKVYQAGGAIKMGSSSALGWISTPPINLSANGGVFTLSFKAMAWSGDQSSIKVFVNEVENIIEGLPNDNNYSFKEYNIVLSGGTNTTIELGS